MVAVMQEHTSTNASEYLTFLETKKLAARPVGVDISDYAIHPMLHPFQKAIVQLACRKGRFAVFAKMGLGKTFIADEIARNMGGRSLIIAPLAVARQTVRESARIGLTVTYSRHMDDMAENGITITNYEMAKHFDPSLFTTVCLDESSILKGIDGKTRQALTEQFADTPYRFCFTATPAPNDITEMANHAEFLGIMTRNDMLAKFFTHDDAGWRLKRHAEEPFYRWLASWSVSINTPSDLGFSDEGYELPSLTINPVYVETSYRGDGHLFFAGLDGVGDRARERKATLLPRVQTAADRINSHDDQVLVFVGLNDEGRELHKRIPGSVLVEGGQSDASKSQALEDFQNNKYRVLITKSKIAGLGMNFQQCHRLMFVGINDSFETYFQGIGRVLRYGQVSEVVVDIVLSTTMQEVYTNVLRKERESREMIQKLIDGVQRYEQEELNGMASDWEYTTDTVEGADYKLMLGDSTQRLGEIPDESVGLSVFSPPFLSLYTYSPSERDLGNSKTAEEFYQHFTYIIDHLLRVTMPGRNACVHVAQVPAMLVRDGYIGMKDFRGETIKAFEDRGWIYHGEVCIDKDPQALKNGTPVMTPRGWVPIERLAIGDQVIGSSGSATNVVGVWPQGERPLYKVTFSDGAIVTCDGHHLWNVRTLMSRAMGNGFKTMRTDAILEGGLYTPDGRRRYEVPLVGEVKYADGEPLPIDPYLVGALLGDGNITQRSTVAITTQHEIVAYCPLPAGHTWRHLPGSDKGDETVATYNLHGDEWHQNDVLSALRILGLQGMRAWEKRIPISYLMASVQDRRSLLQGLLDTDGKITNNGSVKFHTTSEQLALDVMNLVQSLGGVARHRIETVRAYEHKGETLNGRPLHEISVRLNGDWCPFAYAPKAERFKSTRRQPRREIVSIEPVETAECTCITVEADDGLYVTEHFVVTHNSQAIRTKSKALLFAQLHKDSSWCRPAMADYILLFRKPGDNPNPILPDLTNNEWIEWARPIWYGIKESNTLNVAEGRDANDERHIAPLQLGVIERCIRLWSNPGDMVVSPFLGIGSEGHEAVRLGRRFTGCELKPSYFKAACRNVARAAQQKVQPTLFDTIA